jgi:REP element-mobilizing transposase RayT
MYFVTICTVDRTCLFGRVVDGAMQLNDAGQVARNCWLAISAHFPEVVALDAFQVMPNHLHGIVVLGAETQEGAETAATGEACLAPTRGGLRLPSLGVVVGGFKSAAASEVNRLRGTPGGRVWQRDFYDHIIRGEQSLERVRQYILDNPLRWAIDRENPAAKAR